MNRAGVSLGAVVVALARDIADVAEKERTTVQAIEPLTTSARRCREAGLVRKGMSIVAFRGYAGSALPKLDDSGRKSGGY